MSGVPPSLKLRRGKHGSVIANLSAHCVRYVAASGLSARGYLIRRLDAKESTKVNRSHYLKTAYSIYA